MELSFSTAANNVMQDHNLKSSYVSSISVPFFHQVEPLMKFQSGIVPKWMLQIGRFRKGLYRIIKKELPSVFKKLKFYKAIKSTEKYVVRAQVEDSYAIYDDDEIGFSIQLDLETEVICLNNWKTQIEIGDWNK